MCDYVCVCIYVFSCMRCFLFGGLLLDPAWRNWPFRAFPVLPTRSKLLCELVSAWNEHIWFFCCVFILSHVSAGCCLVVITGIFFFAFFCPYFILHGVTFGLCFLLQPFISRRFPCLLKVLLLVGFLAFQTVQICLYIFRRAMIPKFFQAGSFLFHPLIFSFS